MRRSFFPASLSLLLCSALLSGCVVTNDYIAFDSKAAPSPQIKRYDGNEWASERAVMVAAEKTNNWQTVISVGNDVIAKNPTNVEARIYLARAFTKTGDPRQALRVLSFISGVDTAELRIERARALIALTDFEEAVKLLKPPHGWFRFAEALRGRSTFCEVARSRCVFHVEELCSCRQVVRGTAR